MFKMKILIFLAVFLVVVIIVIIAVSLIIKKRRKKYSILEVNGKYVPMIEGGRYLYKDANTGILMGGIGDEYMLLDTEDEAKKFIDEYHKQML